MVPTHGSPLLDLAKLKCYKQWYTKYCIYGTATPSNKVARAGHKLGVCDYDKLVTNRILHYLTTISSQALFGQLIMVISDARAATYHCGVSSQYIRLSWTKTYGTCSLYWNHNWTPDNIPKLPKPPTTATDNNHPAAPSYCPPTHYNPPDICRRYPHMENWLTHVRDGRYMLSQQLTIPAVNTCRDTTLTHGKNIQPAVTIPTCSRYSTGRPSHITPPTPATVSDASPMVNIFNPTVTIPARPTETS